MIEAGAPSTGGYVACSYGVPAPPGIVILAPPTPQRNASRAQCEGRADKEDGKGNGAAKGIIEAGTRKPRPGVLEELQ